MPNKMRSLLAKSIFMLLFFVNSAQASTILWYNGDPDLYTGLSSEISGQVGGSLTYDDFLVPHGGWEIDKAFSHFGSYGYQANRGLVEIRSHLEPGQQGNVWIQKFDAGVQTDTGIRMYEAPVYKFEMAINQLFLPPGRYWLGIAPIDTQSQAQAFVTTTSGDNAVGQPAGDNGNAFFNSNSFNETFVRVSDLGNPDAGDYDFSYGILGTPVPEPATATLLLFGGFMRWILKRLKTSYLTTSRLL